MNGATPRATLPPFASEYRFPSGATKTTYPFTASLSGWAMTSSENLSPAFTVLAPGTA